MKDVSDYARSLAFTPDERLLAGACGVFLRIWDATTGDLVVRMKVDQTHFQAVGFTPDGRFLVAGRNDGTVQFYETGTWREHAAFDWGIGPLACLVVARDGMRAAVGSKKGKILVWDLDL